MLLFDEMPDDLPAPRRVYRGRCQDCWQYAGHAHGCPNEEVEHEETQEVES